QEMAYFREARSVHGMKLEQIALLFEKSLRTVSSLNRRYKDDFFKPERDVAFRRAIAALVNHAPTTREGLEGAFPGASPAELDAALEDMVRGGILDQEGALYRRSPGGYSFVAEEDFIARVDGLNRQMDVLAETAQSLFVEGGSPGRARTWVFQSSPADFAALISELEQRTRSAAMKADQSAEEVGDGVTYGVTFAAAPMKET
ncbi:MAG: hypothetical protein VX498_10320, partial [Myxococcota bacterium]|nr:hypothetical protein [Myxococcota bacterium]